MLLDFISDVAVIIAAVAGGVWAFYRFRKMRMGESAIQIKLIPEVYHYGKSNLVNVTIQLENVGRAPAYIKCPNPKCLLEARAIPAELRDSVISMDNLSPLFEPIEFLKDFYSWHPNEPYVIEPRSTDTIHLIFSTTYNGIILLQASVVDKEDYLYIAKKFVDLRKATSPNTT